MTYAELIQQEAERRYPLIEHILRQPAHITAQTNADNYFINNHRTNFIEGATFGLSLAEKRIAELKEDFDVLTDLISTKDKEIERLERVIRKMNTDAVAVEKYIEQLIAKL